MYTRNNTFVKSNSIDLTKFCEVKPNGVIDYSNSELLYKLDTNKDWKTYSVTKYEGRVDLISWDIYGSIDYSWIILYVNKISIFDIKRGVTLKYPPLSTLTNIINSL